MKVLEKSPKFPFVNMERSVKEFSFLILHHKCSSRRLWLNVYITILTEVGPDLPWVPECHNYGYYDVWYQLQDIYWHKSHTNFRGWMSLNIAVTLGEKHFFAGWLTRWGDCFYYYCIQSWELSLHDHTSWQFSFDTCLKYRENSLKWQAQSKTHIFRMKRPCLAK